MANIVSTKLVQDGPRNAVVLVTGTLDTADLVAGATILINPATLSQIGGVEGLANRVALDHIDYIIEDLLVCSLYWDATVPTLAANLVGRGTINFTGQLSNPETAGTTGIVRLATQGWGAGAILSFTLQVCFVKYIK